MGAFDFLKTDANQHGWHTPTSTIDWCELNYTYSYYIAELVNTLTNVPVIALGLYCAYATVANGVPPRYALVYLGLALIGIGSFGFHASLQWEWQLMDELPMIYVASYAAYLVIDTLPGWKHRFGPSGPIAVLAWCIFVTVSYISLPNPVYHQIAFAGIMTTASLRSIYLLFRLPAERRAKIARLLLIGLGIFVGGFGIWNLDNYFCTELRATRAWLEDRGLGELGHFTQGHGYWHLMTGYGGALLFTAAVALCLEVKTSPYAYDFDATSWFPVVYTVPHDQRDHLKALETLDEKAPLVDASGTSSSFTESRTTTARRTSDPTSVERA
ncbi:Alkaline ceramidase 3 [Vanrija pseudolonga]|uniref:Alkaline ceramidase 3 n=1 Tax=Vanrija pseudolonga TaxID=143232 RepID=A0AAF1BN71_9TREE|nr:Alkaline ceramidase 3 [Vanrija pseudolonga]